MDTTQSILRSARHFFSGTMLSRITGVLRDMSMAAAFGTHSTVAAFFVAYRLAHLLRRVLGEGAMQTALIPLFEELRTDHPRRASRFFADLYVLITMVLGIIIVVTYFAVNKSMGLFSDGGREIAELALLMLPSLLFICLFGLNSALLQCEKKYFVPGAAPVFFNLTWIAGTYAILYLGPENPMKWLAGIIILACFFQWLYTVPATLSALRSHGLATFFEDLSLFSKDLRLIGKPLFLGILGIAAAQINNAVDGLFARYADNEGPALLWYAIRIQQLPLSLFAIALSGAILPPLTRALKENNWEKFIHFLKFAIKKCLWVIVPFSVILVLFGKLGIEIVYGHGQFTEQSVIGTTHCLWAYTLGLIPMALVLVIAPAFYAQNRYSIPTAASVASMTLNIALNSIMVFYMGLGAISVALATSASAWMNFLILAVMLKRLKVTQRCDVESFTGYAGSITQ